MDLRTQADYAVNGTGSEILEERDTPLYKYSYTVRHRGGNRIKTVGISMNSSNAAARGSESEARRNQHDVLLPVVIS